MQLADFRFFLFAAAIAPLHGGALRARGTGLPEHRVNYDTPPSSNFPLAARASVRYHVERPQAHSPSPPPAPPLFTPQSPPKTPTSIWEANVLGHPARRQAAAVFERVFRANLITLHPTKRAGAIGSKARAFILGKQIRTSLVVARRSVYRGSPRGPCRAELFCYLEIASRLDCNDKRVERPRRNNPSRGGIFEPPAHPHQPRLWARSGFATSRVLFQHSLQAIHGPEEDEALLLFLTAYLRSNLAKYFCFHTSSKTRHRAGRRAL